ncbi:MAG TPA: HAD family hydrolase [Anaerolineae bacterium]|nr:HAD family hydrolase [Anaerolineae bacterium]HOR00064.1 HAD family hydrolase [Anaerolineae bacterium]HPL29441.1 HAD family hydrolase [Anaerolineae bacterium]
MAVDRSPWLRVLRPAALPRPMPIAHAFFDMDGTLSLLRQGWEQVMVPLMVEAIGGAGPADAAIEREVREYVDRSTGLLTIEQMRWLAAAVRRHGRAPALTPAAYKARYLARLMQPVRTRLAALASGSATPAEHMVAAAAGLLAGLQRRGVTLYLASGTDHADVVREAQALGLDRYFDGRIYGALDDSDANAKDRVLARILSEHRLAGPELLVAGDGPVELRHARACGALALGVASDEVAGRGWNEHKVPRLAAAGAELLIADYAEHEALVEMLCTA